MWSVLKNDVSACSLPFLITVSLSPSHTEMSVRMSNLDNERDERDEDSHEDRGISKFRAVNLISKWTFLLR